jgi:GT2 family glycosyltransferase
MDRSDCAGFASVLINWHDITNTLHCIESILGSPSAKRIIVVDNESDHHLREVIGDNPAVEVIEVAANVGFAAGMNIGIQAALLSDQSNILLINNDVVCCPRSLDLLLSALISTDAGVVAPLIRSTTGATITTGCRLRPWTMAIDLVCEAPEFFTWACIMVTRDVFDRFGLLDERYFTYWEDVEYGMRLHAEGVKCELVPDAVVIHDGGASHSIAGAHNIGEYSAYGLVRFARSQSSFAIKCGTTIRVIARLSVALLKGKSQIARGIVRGTILGMVFDGRGQDIYPRSHLPSLAAHRDEPQ